MAEKADKMAEMSRRLKEWTDSHEEASFWVDGKPCLEYGALSEMLEAPIKAGDDVRTGRFAASVDLWIAYEMYRAGFDEGLWPRIETPRVIDPDTEKAIHKLPLLMQQRAMDDAGSVDAVVRGSVYSKQVDVGLSSWLAGPELLVSTKTMSGSYGKNLANRFEEAYGDEKNLRGRYPLAAHGFFFVMRDSVRDEKGSFEKAIHMLRQLMRDGDVYDAVGLLLVDWDDATGAVVVPADGNEDIPDDLLPERFFDTLIKIVLREAPIDVHRRAREIIKKSSMGEI